MSWIILENADHCGRWQVLTAWEDFDMTTSELFDTAEEYGVGDVVHFLTKKGAENFAKENVATAYKIMEV